MKKLINRLSFLSLLLIIQINTVKAQGTYNFNGHYLYSPFKDYQCTTQYHAGCAYWNGNCYEGWERAYGTPSCTNLQSPEQVYMFSNAMLDGHNGAGEGIYHPFVFNAGDLVTVNIKVSNLSSRYVSNGVFTSIAGAKIEVWAIKDLATFKAMTNTATVQGCGDWSYTNLPPYHVLYTTPVSQGGLGTPELIGEYKVTQIATSGLPNGPLTNQLLTFTTQPLQHNNTEILIFANFDQTYTGNGNNPTDIADLTIDYVEVDVCRGGQVQYFQHNSFVPDGVTMKDFIDIGVWTNSTLVSAQSNSNTELYAAATNVFGTFNCIVDDEHYFLIDTKEYCGTILYKPGRKETKEELETSKPNLYEDVIPKCTIYPNPTTGAFNIEIPQKGNYTLRVMNMLGTTVYEGKITDEQKKSIQLDTNLPPGNYTLHISGDGLRHVERITLTK